MEDNQKILSFANIEIVEYLNSVHKTQDHFLIETQKHNLNKYQNQLNEHFRKLFISSSEPLLEILDTYQYCSNLLSSHTLPRPFLEEESININGSKCKAFKKLCEEFNDDMEPFVTEKRYLVASEYFGKYLLLLTNDILFIGEKREDSKYDLMHSLSKNIIDLRINKDTLVLRVSGGIYYEFTGSEQDVSDFYDTFQEIIYEYSPKKDSPIKNDFDHDFLEYLIITEQTDCIVEYVGDRDNQALHNMKLSSKNEFSKIYKILKNPKPFFITYMNRRFSECLLKINKIQPLSGLINDSFNLLEKFVTALHDMSEEVGVKKLEYILCVERLIETLFESIEKRVFNKFYQIKINSESIDLIRSRLKFGNLDFQYLIKRLLSKKEDFAKKCVEAAKDEIKRNVESLFRSKL